MGICYIRPLKTKNHNAKITGTFYEKELQKSNQTGFRVEKVLKGHGDELYIK